MRPSEDRRRSAIRPASSFLNPWVFSSSLRLHRLRPPAPCVSGSGVLSEATLAHSPEIFRATPPVVIPTKVSLGNLIIGPRFHNAHDLVLGLGVSIPLGEGTEFRRSSSCLLALLVHARWYSGEFVRLARGGTTASTPPASKSARTSSLSNARSATTSGRR